MTKLAIITGASNGIGFETAKLFLAQGWEVANISRTACKITGVHNLLVDLSVAEAVQGLQTELMKLVPTPIQIALIHNAMRYQHDTIHVWQVNEFQRQIEVTLTSPRFINMWLIPKMLPQSAIIYVGSTLSEKAVPNAASYSILKHAQVGMMRATCQDLSTTGIHTCCVCPGFTNTEMLRSHIGDSPQAIDTIKKRVGANRLIEPTEIAETIFFCANHAVINGSVLHANLGQIAR